MNSHVFLDESGDLGWKLNRPYRDGGSSRYLTIGYLITPITHINIPKRLVRDFYAKYNFNPKQEIKASVLKSHHKEFICRETVKMMDKYDNFYLGAITVKKSNVARHIRNDGNKLYNYMINIAILNIIEEHITCKITRDNRTIKVASGQSCIDYLQTILWLHKNKAIILTDNPQHSHNDDGLIFIDWITNIVWSMHEDGYCDWRNILGIRLNDQRLFFNP